MEQLNKQQIILLALLVSFVSSIATGIVVVSIMEQNSQPTITQTINRVVERTIERAVAPDVQGQSTVRETLIVREDEAVVNAIEKASRSVVRIFYSYGGEQRFAGLGIIISSSGIIAAKIEVPEGSLLSARLAGGNEVGGTVIGRDLDLGLTIIQAEQGRDPLDTRVYTASVMADSKEAKLGQSVIVMGREDGYRVATGILSSVSENLLRASVVDPAFDSQAILVNLRGEVLGMKYGNTAEDGFVTSNNIKKYATP